MILRIEREVEDTEIGVAMELFDAGGDYEFVGAFQADDLIGYACFGATPATDRTYDLYWIAVHPNAQRSGAGAALMAEVERQLEQRRARLVVVETSSREDYAPTRRFYDKLGYAEAARLRDLLDARPVEALRADHASRRLEDGALAKLGAALGPDRDRHTERSVT